MKVKLKANEVGILLTYEIKTKTSNKKAIRISQDKLLKKIKVIYFSNIVWVSTILRSVDEHFGSPSEKEKPSNTDRKELVNR